MEGTITVSPSEIVGMLLGLCAALGTLSVGITSVTKFLKWKNRPNEDQNKRLDEHDERFRIIDLKFEDTELEPPREPNMLEPFEVIEIRPPYLKMKEIIKAMNERQNDTQFNRLYRNAER